jgi:hypothetical protein
VVADQPVHGDQDVTGAGTGQFVFVPNDDGTVAVTVNLIATDQYPATYTAK